MIRRSFRIGLWLGLIAGITVAVAKLVQARHAPPEPALGRAPSEPPARPWPRLEEPVAPAVVAAPAAAAPAPRVEQAPAPAPRVASAPTPIARKAPVAKKAPTAKKAPVKKVVAAWVDPEGNMCPKTHPVKAKLSSKIFQIPGMFAYERTNPDRCYKDPATAEADGFRPAKR